VLELSPAQASTGTKRTENNTNTKPREQRTELAKKKKVMKQMKTTLLTTVALAACVGTQVFAQNSKLDTITFSLSLQGQASVSTSATAVNAGDWSEGPKYYKTTGITKMTQAAIIKDIGKVLGRSYTAKAQLVLVQGELSGFFNVIPGLSNAVPEYSDSDFAWLDGYYDTSGDGDLDVDSTILSADTLTFATLDNGRHYQVNPVPGAAYPYPVGHFQPWGQIFVQDPGYPDYSATDPLCDNVTFFFSLDVQECYDCFYMNSFISDAAFTVKAGTAGGPPCCTPGSSLLGRGTDHYYLTWSFDDTQVNPYLNTNNYDDSTSAQAGYYVGIPGIVPSVGSLDGTLPDALPYVDSIKSGLGTPSPYEARFTLNGIVTYAWNLNFVNKTDILPDFVGTATYAANGYGFIALTCQLITGTATIKESIVKSATCCLDLPWYDSWYGIGWDGDVVGGDVVYEVDAPGEPAGTNGTTQVNTPVSLSYHFAPNNLYYHPPVDWTDSPAGEGPVVYSTTPDSTNDVESVVK
jgi:hypothetical protein